MTSFETAAETIIAEGLGASTILEDTQTAREFVGRLLAYIDGILYVRDGKVALKLIRKESTVGLPTVTEADLLEEPEPTNQGIEKTWNLTRIVPFDTGGARVRARLRALSGLPEARSHPGAVEMAA